MFDNQPKQPNITPRPFRPTKPPTDEPEDILSGVEPDIPARPASTMPPKIVQAPRPQQSFAKKVAPPPEIDKVSAPVAQKPLAEEARAKDIFLQVDPNPEKPGIPVGLKIKEPSANIPEPVEETERRRPLLRSKIFIVILLLIFGAGVIGLAGYFVYSQLNASKYSSNNNAENTNSANDNVNTEMNINNSGIEETNLNMQPTVEITPAPSIDEGQADSDADGLTDAEEKLYGTNPNKADSDGDGLTDRDETKIWKTDPLDPDTDEDGFKDGDEVKNKYNPLGPGRLMEMPQ